MRDNLSNRLALNGKNNRDLKNIVYYSLNILFNILNNDKLFL